MPKNDKNDKDNDDSTAKCVQVLMEAEKRAREKLEQSRKKKALRLKAARDEAQFEIDKLKRISEDKFNKSNRANLNSHDTLVAKYDKFTKDSISNLLQYYTRNKGVALQFIMKEFQLIRPEFHQNLFPKEII